MPLTGLLSFLQKRDIPDDVFGTLCQCPQRAYFHFYTPTKQKKLVAINVSMPSTGLLSFLRTAMFLTIVAMVCQCPQRAYFHFYDISKVIFMRLLQCVNALNGLTFISTTVTKELVNTSE